MPFGFVRVQHPAGLRRECRIDLKESLGNIFMYRTFADPKLLCRLPYSGVAFYDIIGDFYGSFFNIIFQENPPANLVFTMYEKRGRFITLFFLIWQGSSVEDSYAIHVGNKIRVL